MGIYRYCFRWRKLCPVCSKHSFEEAGKYEICPVCGWEDDPVQRRDPDFPGGANKMSLNEAIEAYRQGGKDDE